MLSKLKARASSMKTIAVLLQHAEEIARHGGAETPGAEHLVLAALQLPDGTAARAFAQVGSSGDGFRSALEAQEAEDLARVGVHAPVERISEELPSPSAPTGIYRSEPSAQELFRAAGDDARRRGGVLLGAHVVRAAAALQQGPTARALQRMGVDRDALRAAADTEIEAHRRT